MRAFHTFWSAPNRARNGVVAVPDYELLTLMLSALKWRQLNGTIRLVTDSAGAAFFERAGLTELWSEPIDIALDRMDASFDPQLFWAAGKLEALRLTPAPCVMLDADMILWRDIRPLLADAAVAAHRETLSPSVYPDPSAAFRLDPGYAFPREWDFTLPAANTAFLYLPGDGLREYYVNSAFRFMNALQSADAGPVVSMCFAEQRILPMCARARGVRLDTLLDQRALDEQDFVTHLWGQKRELAASPERRIEYCLGCVLRLLSDFPEWEDVLAKNEQTAGYVESLRQTRGNAGIGNTGGKET